MLFSQEMNGYNRQEVDAHIKRMQATFEARLMEEKLKALDSERRMLDLKNERTEIENKEKNILNALSVIEKAKKFQEEGNRNFYKLLMDKLEILVSELSMKFPQLRLDQNFDALLNEFSEMVHSYKDNLDKMNDITRPIYSDNDSMRLLLNKMQDYKKGHSAPKEVRINVQRTIVESPPSQTETVQNATPQNSNFQNANLHGANTQNANPQGASSQNTNLQNTSPRNANIHNTNTLNASPQNTNTLNPNPLNANPQSNAQASKTLTKATPNYSLERKNITFVYPDQDASKQPQTHFAQKPAPTFYGTSESGFNLEEALHPTDDLAEIMKAFDFFNDN